MNYWKPYENIRRQKRKNKLIISISAQQNEVQVGTTMVFNPYQEKTPKCNIHTHIYEYFNLLVIFYKSKFGTNIGYMINTTHS